MLDKILDQLNWRMAVKNFDKNKKLSDDQLECLVETARMAPTSYGLQPIQLYVVSEEAIKQKLFEAGYNQPQFSTASHVFILVARKKITQEDVDGQIKRTANQQNMSEESLFGYREALENNLMSLSKEDAYHWSAKQAYLVLGMMMSTAAECKIDVSPMEGFSQDKFDEVLGCKDAGYKSVLALAAGFRDVNDGYVKKPKVRKTKDEFVKFL